jgi:REP element-mobilizing transposase RayT
MIRKSPFSKQIGSTAPSPFGAGVDENGNETWTDSFGITRITKYADVTKPVVTVPSATAGDSGFSGNPAFNLEVTKLMREMRTKGSKLDMKVQNDPNLSEAEKRKWAEDVLRTQKGDNISGIIQNSLSSGLINPFKKYIGKPALAASEGLIRGIQAGAVEATEGIGQFFMPQTADGQKIVLKSRDKSGNWVPVKADLGEFADKATDSSWLIGRNNWYNGGKADENLAVELAAGVVFDPLTYMTMGASVSSKAGRLALSNRMVPMITKYPELKPLLGNIARYGPTEIPKYIREAEGIFSGVKWFGQEVKYSDGLAKAWRYTGGALRANIGDIALTSKPGQFLEAITTPKLMRPAVQSGIFRAGSMNRFNQDFLVSLAERSAQFNTRGHGRLMTEIISAESQPHIELLNLLDETGDATFNNIVHAVESPTLIGGLSPAAREAAYKFKDWSDAIYSRLQEKTRDLARTRGIDINELSYLDDHVYHQLTPIAKEDIFGSKGRFKKEKLFDLTTHDVIESGGPLQFRKYKKGERFLNTELQHGTIAEINKVYGDFLESKGFPRANFFEEDLRIITESYGQSVARAHARLRFVDTMFNYGPDVIKPLMIDKVIPDAKLLSSMRDELSKLERLRATLVKRVKVGADTTKIRGAVAKEFREATGIITQALDGVYMAKAANSDEAIRIAGELEQLIKRLEDSRQYAMGLSVQERGYWADAHVGLLTEAHNLREAIIAGQGDRYIARQRLTQIYYAEFPNSDGSELVDKPLEWIAERVSRSLNDGKAFSNHEIPALQFKLDKIIADIDATPKTSENIQKLKILDDKRTELLAQLGGHEELDAVREAASYSSTGVLFGSPPVAGEPIPYQMWTSYIPAGEVDTFRQMPDSIMRHAIPEEQLVDFRTTDHMLAMVDDPSTLYEFGYSWGKLGKPDLTWNSVVDDAFENGRVDDLLWQVNPEKAMLIDGFLQFSEVVNRAIDDGVDLTDGEVSAFFNMIKDANYNVIAALDAPNAEAVSRRVVNDFFESLINAADQEGFDGILVPAKALIDDAGTSDWSVLVHKTTPTPEVGTEYYDEVQFVMDNALADSILDNTTEMSRLQLMDNADSLAQDGLDVEIVQASRRELEDQLFRGEQLLETAKIAQKADEDMVLVNGELIPRFLAESKLSKIEDRIQGTYSRIDDEVWATTEKEFGVEAIETRIKDLNVERMINFDNAKALKDWTPELEEQIVGEVAAMVLHLRNIPDQGVSVGANAAWVKKAEQMMASSSLIDDPAVREAYDKVIKIVLADEVALAKVEADLFDLSLETYLTEMGDRGGRIIYEKAEEGWKELEALGVQMPKEVLERWMPSLKRLDDPSELRKFAKALGRNQGYWKKYVTNTMGFLVRNGYSGTFMNYADGVTGDHMLEGAKWASAQGPIIRNESNWKKSGKSYLDWMERAGIDVNNPAAVAEANKVMEIVYATSRGTSTDNAMPVVERWKVTKWMDKNPVSAKWKLGDNPYLNLFTSKNDFVERALRIPMALDSVRQGHTIDEAVARISRVHFDYGDLSQLDEAAKKLIPFWIWTSRNVPLQITQMATRPKAYYQYDKIKQALPLVEDDPTTPEDEGMIVPKWIKDYGPLQVGLGSLLRPDLPHVRMRQQIENLLNPMKLVGNVTPTLRVPFEVFGAKRQLGIDVGPFKKDAEARGYEQYVAKFMAKLGMYKFIDRDPKTGDWLMHAGVSYIIEQALVPLQQINRLTGGWTGGKANLNERWLSSVLNWFGIPYQGVGLEQEKSELIRRDFNVKALEDELEKKQRIEKDYSSTP